MEPPKKAEDDNTRREGAEVGPSDEAVNGWDVWTGPERTEPEGTGPGQKRRSGALVVCGRNFAG